MTAVSPATPRHPRAVLALRWAGVPVSAVLYGLSFPPDGWPVLAWIALVPLFVALAGASSHAAFALSWVSGLVMAWTVTDFLPRAIANYYEQTPLFGAVLFVVVVSLMCCPSHILFALWYRSRVRPSGAAGVMLAGAAWVAAELMRGRFQGNPWGTLAYTQAGTAALIQIADVTGVYGVSFAVVAVNAAVAELVRRRAGAGRALLAALGVVIVVLGYGWARLAETPATEEGRAVRVAVVQGNNDLGRQWRFELYGENLRDYLRMTTRVLERDDPALVVWPENAMTFFVEDEPLYRRAIGAVLGGTELIAGGVSQTETEPPVYRNSAFLLGEGGEVRGRYDKRILLPFAEYFPFATIGFLNRRFGAVRQFTAGGPTPPLPTVAGKAAVVTCNEVLFPAVVGARVAAGAELIVTLANDGWLGDPRYSTRVLDFCRLRAVEQRRFVVRAASAGGSAVVSPQGTIAEQSVPFTATAIAGDVAPHAERTVYGRLGDVFAFGCVLAVLASLVRLSSRARRDAPDPTRARAT